MRTFKYNMAFVIVLISFYCSVAIESPLLGAEYSAPSKDSEPIPGIVKNEHESLATEEILSTKKYLKRHLKNAKKEGFPEKSPDREHQPIVVEKEAPSTAVEKDAHPTVSSLEPPATSLTTQTPTEGSEIFSIIPEKELPSAPIIEEKEGTAGKEHLTDNGNQHSIVEEEVTQDTEEKGILSTPPPPFPPESSSPSGKEEGSLLMEETDTQTTSLQELRGKIYSKAKTD